MSKVESGRCCSETNGPEQAARRQEGIRLLGKLAWGHVGLGAANAVMALTMLILALTSNPERAPIVGSSVSLGASLMSLTAGILAFSARAAFNPSDSDVSTKLKCMFIGHYALCISIPSANINGLVWLGMSLAQVENPTQALTGVTITTLVLNALRALVDVVGATVYCRYARAFGIWRQCYQQVEEQSKPQQQGTPPPPAYDDGLTKDKSQGGFPAGYSSF